MPEKSFNPRSDERRPRVDDVRRALTAGYYRVGADRVAGSIVRKLALRRVRVSSMRARVIAGEYEVDADAVAAAIVRKLEERDERAGEESAPNDVGEPRIGLAPSQPTTEELARAQLNRYAIDLKRSYERELRRSKELEEASVSTVRALALVAERDDETGNHIQRVHDVGLLLAREVIPEDAEDPQLAYGLILHDIGKVAVPDAVLRKAEPLDETERVLMEAHPVVGARILEPLPFLDRAREVVLHHHERWDGSGYPDGLEGDAIPFWARVLAVADALDAMVGREEPSAHRLEMALERIVEASGTLFDPRCVSGAVALDRAQLLRALHPAAENTLRTLAA
jgi:HD-GYP domain-containing protein (c-di-GMP phosphodiesterase class II)